MVVRILKWIKKWQEKRRLKEIREKHERQQKLWMSHRWPSREEVLARQQAVYNSLSEEERAEWDRHKERMAELEEQLSPFHAPLAFGYFFYNEIYFPEVAEELTTYGVDESRLYDALMAWVKEVGFPAYDVLRELWQVYACCSQYNPHAYKLYAYALFHLTEAIEGSITHKELRNLLENVDKTFSLPHIPLSNPNADCICGEREEDRVDEARALAILEELVEAYQRKHHMSLLISERIKEERNIQGDL